jgi:hypothetical protein
VLIAAVTTTTTTTTATTTNNNNNINNNNNNHHIQKIREQHSRKPRSQRTTENSHIGHCTHTSESANVKA